MMLEVILLLIKSTAPLLLLNSVPSESVCPSVCVGSTISNTFVVTRLNVCSFWYRLVQLERSVKLFIVSKQVTGKEAAETLAG